MATSHLPSAAPHPDSPYPVTTGSRPERLTAGEGLLEVTLRSAAKAEAEGRGPGKRPGPGDVLRYPVPGVPVLIIGSRPVAQGSGTVWVRLPPGVHRISVQAGGFAGWWTADVEPGRVTRMEAYPDQAWSRTAEPPLVPARFAETVRYWTIALYLPAAFAAVLLLAAVPGCLIGMFSPDLLGTDTRRSNGYGFFAVLILTLWAVMAIRHIGTMQSTRRHLQRQAALAAEPVGGGVESYPLALHADRIDGTVPGTGALLLDLTWEVVWQRITADTPIDWLAMQYSGEPGPIERRPWMPPPTVRIDGVETALDWGRWRIPLPAGDHQVEVSIPRTAGTDTPSNGRGVRWKGTVGVAEGWFTRVRLNGRVIQHVERREARLRATGFEAEVRSHLAEGRLPDFRERRLETEMLDGQHNPRMRHSVIDPSDTAF